MDPEYSSDSLNALMNGYRHIVVVDIEHTCKMDGSIPPEERETIEIGAVLIDTCSLQLVDEFSRLIRPVIHPELSQFCIELTGIKQAELDVAAHFPEVFAHFIDWLPNNSDYVLATWGSYDLVQLNIDCALHGMPAFSPSTTLNLKVAFKEARNLKKKVGLKRALEISNLSYEGSHHRALDDAKNTAKLLPLIFKRSGIYEATIIFEINDDSLTMDEIDDSLFDVGFDDAIVSHSGDGRIAIEFSRDSTSYDNLVESVVAKIKDAIPSAKEIQASYGSRQTSQIQRPNPFKNSDRENPGIDITTSRVRSQKKLKSIFEIEDGDIVDIPDGKEMLHPARYFEDLFLHKLRPQGLSNNDLSKRLGLAVEQFDDFLIEKISVTLTLAKRLEAVTGMSYEFWIRTQSKFDNSRK
ncbi:exonuclease domain-containing protein [Pseudoalteromonas maricaloris]|uniref:exonuclease domain-containing protein n=1 Tax=Pseudoalteromonas maricaloris TaxID=184924 RepID=UPI003C1BEF83